MCPCSSLSLLPATVNQGLHLDALPDIEKSDPFRLSEGIGAKPEEIYFTAGGSESDNWAMKAAVEAYAAKGKHIITTKIEHHAILHT